MIYVLPRDWDHATKDALCEWLEANGVDPRTLPMHAEIEVTDAAITYYEWGRPDALWVRRTVPLISPMPEGLAARCRLPQTLCPHCGADINAPTELSSPATY